MEYEICEVIKMYNELLITRNEMIWKIFKLALKIKKPTGWR